MIRTNVAISAPIAAGCSGRCDEWTRVGFSESYRKEIEERLSSVVPIRTRSMFGGVGIYSNDLFFALIAEDKLYFKVDDSNRGDFEAQNMQPFFPFDTAKPMGYWELPADVLIDGKELEIWIGKALKVAETATVKKIARINR